MAQWNNTGGDLIHWQEWSSDITQYAQAHNKIIFISVGYTTCHWCMIMDKETFQDKDVADFINKQCVAVRVDREKRPDIDHYLMSFALESESAAGWPLNVFLTPDLKPFAATTYLPPKRDGNIPGFIEVLHTVVNYYQNNKNTIRQYQLPIPQTPPLSEQDLLTSINNHYDPLNGGFGDAPKFAQQCTLLFLLYYFERTKNQNVYGMLKKTLDALAQGGIHDHLQGGFFRYSIDQHWMIPHFEKTLFDQALLLWVFSLAHAVLKIDDYVHVARSTTQCLEQTFAHNSLFFAALSADADGTDAASYLWRYDEIKSILSPQELTEFSRTYLFHEPEQDTRIHLIKTRGGLLPDIEQKLLHARAQRPQPRVDKKIITSWNALAGIGLIMAHRYTGNTVALEKAEALFKNILKIHFIDGVMRHSSFDLQAQQEGFLQDSASMLLLCTYLVEDTGNYRDVMETLNTAMHSFYKDGVWYEAVDTDFMPIPALIGDQTIPASNSLVQLALLRMQLLKHETPQPFAYKEGLLFDFFNISAFMSNGNFHLIDTPTNINWQELPVNVLQRPGNTVKDCFASKCTDHDSVDDLVNAISD
jgi:uncharacterized protein YyaL (SSP411 family)